MTLFDYVSAHPVWTLVYLSIIVGGFAAVASVVRGNRG